MSEQRWGPLERRQYLAALDGAPGPTIFDQIAHAERIAAATESDWDSAVADLRAAGDASPDADLAASRALSPDARHRLVQLYAAQDRSNRAADAYTQARRNLDNLLAQLDHLSRPDLGLAPGPSWQ